jgi:hypothetical protein
MGQFNREIRKDQRTEVQWMGHKTTVPVRIRNKLRMEKWESRKEQRIQHFLMGNTEIK